MSSIYTRALGARFAALHPEIQKRFGFSSEDGMASIGTGVMEEVWHGPPYTLPFLYVGTWRHILIPRAGRDVPFRIENYAYRDRFGRETVTWTRTFRFPGGPLHFDATMIYSDQRSKIVDYLGTHQHLAVDIDLDVSPQGGLRLVSGDQRFYESALGFRFPMLFSGIARVHEWYDEAESRFRIEVTVANPLWGRLCGYRGWFTVDWKRCASAAVPARVKPVREEARE